MYVCIKSLKPLITFVCQKILHCLIGFIFPPKKSPISEIMETGDGKPELQFRMGENHSEERDVNSLLKLARFVISCVLIANIIIKNLLKALRNVRRFPTIAQEWKNFCTNIFPKRIKPSGGYLSPSVCACTRVWNCVPILVCTYISAV